MSARRFAGAVLLFGLLGVGCGDGSVTSGAPATHTEATRPTPAVDVSPRAADSAELGAEQVVAQCGPVVARVEAVASSLRSGGGPGDVDRLRALVGRCLTATERVEHGPSDDAGAEEAGPRLVDVRRPVRALEASLAQLAREERVSARPDTEPTTAADESASEGLSWRDLLALAEEIRSGVDAIS